MAGDYKVAGSRPSTAANPGIAPRTDGTAAPKQLPFIVTQAPKRELGTFTVQTTSSYEGERPKFYSDTRGNGPWSTANYVPVGFGHVTPKGEHVVTTKTPTVGTQLLFYYRFSANDPFQVSHSSPIVRVVTSNAT